MSMSLDDAAVSIAYKTEAEPPAVSRLVAGAPKRRRAPRRRAKRVKAAAPYLSIVVPCYNESECLEALYRRTRDVCQQLLRPYEVLLINDGSSDATWPMIVELAERDPHVTGVNLSRNFGQQKALSAGLAACRGERILILDADLQDPPELLPEMLQIMDEQQADVVYGQRRRRDGETWLKKTTAAAFYSVLNRLADQPIPRDTGDFRLLTQRVKDALLRMPEPNRFVRGMVSWVGFRQVPLLYDRPARFAGVTKWPLRQMLGLALDAIVGFSLRPLRAVAALAAFCVLAFLMLACIAVRQWLAAGDFGPILPGLLAASLLGAAQLFGLALIAEYAGRIYLQTLGRPLYLVDQIVRCPNSRSEETDRASH